MKTKRIFKIIVILTILVSNIACDQISKNIVRNKMKYNEQISFISNHMFLTKVENSGAFLSLGNSLPGPIKAVLLTILPIIFLLLVFIYLVTKENIPNLTIFAICCIVGGGIGNIYDRFLYGSVTDFLHIDFILFRTGIFNMADVSVMVGTFLLFMGFVIKRSDPANNVTSENN